SRQQELPRRSLITPKCSNHYVSVDYKRDRHRLMILHAISSLQTAKISKTTALWPNLPLKPPCPHLQVAYSAFVPLDILETTLPGSAGLAGVTYALLDRNLMAGPALWRTDASQKPRLRPRRDRDPGLGYRRQYRHLHRHQRRTAAGPAILSSVPAGADRY